MIDRNNFIGLNGFVWWIGEIEATNDDIGIGRCKVRIFGWHTDNKALLSTEDLPWAYPIIPLTTTYTMPNARVGDWVVGFFLDGENAQKPCMMGVLPGLTQKK